MCSEPWDLPADFQFGVARDGHLAETLERIRLGPNLPALAAISMTSTGSVELAATGLRAVRFRERVTVNDQWHLGSITKPMTATVAARVVGKGCNPLMFIFFGRDDLHVVPNPAEGIVWDDVEVVPTGPEWRGLLV